MTRQSDGFTRTNSKESFGGFTIIEVILFLGISSLLLVGAFVAMRQAVANAQFNDTTDTTQSFLQKQYLEVATGVNLRDDSLTCNTSGAIVQSPTGSNPKPGASNCVILGRLLTFDSAAAIDRITTRYISSRVGDTETTSDLGAFVGVGAYQPKLSATSIGQLTSEFELPWAGVLKEASRVAGTSETKNIRTMAIIRSPVSERMMIYAFTSLNPSSADFSQALNLISANRYLHLCLQSDTGILAKQALLSVTPGQGQDLFSVDRSGNYPPERCNG